MTLNTYMRDMLPAIEAELQSVLEQAVSPDYAELRQMMAYHLGWEGESAGPEAQGKRVRPLLVLLSCAAAGGDWRRALPAAAAVELVHNFSLIHDDIQDQSPIRRGRPTVWVKWGTAQAINAGDTMYTLAFMALSRLADAVPPVDALHAQSILQQACLRLTQGQYLDLAYEKRENLSLQDYWPMIEGKTAALLAACSELGSLTGGANPTAQTAFQQFGYYLGLAFQVLDDWLGLWGVPALTGKSNESDLVSGKKTLPVLYGLGQNGEFTRRWQSGLIPAEEAAQVAALLASEGAKDYTQDTADRLNHLALESLAIAGGENEATRALEELAERLLERQA